MLASERNTTNRPSEVTEAAKLGPLLCVPKLEVLTIWIVPVVRSLRKISET